MTQTEMPYWVKECDKKQTEYLEKLVEKGKAEIDENGQIWYMMEMRPLHPVRAFCYFHAPEITISIMVSIFVTILAIRFRRRKLRAK